MYMNKKALALALAMFGFTGLSHAKGLDLSEGTMSIGGAATFDANGPLTSSSNGWTMELGGKFSVDYFVIDNLSVGVNLNGQLPINQTGSKTTGGIALESAYYFKTNGIIYPYVGAGVGVNFVNNQGNATTNTAATASTTTTASTAATATTNALLPVNIDLGVLIGLNDHVAVNLGVTSSFIVPLSGSNTTTDLKLGVGYLGVVGFF